MERERREKKWRNRGKGSQEEGENGVSMRQRTTPHVLLPAGFSLTNAAPC